jgi:uncharacterized protein
VTENTISLRLILGAAIFGSGWALAGLCPGTVISGAFFVYSHALLWLVGFALGKILGAFFFPFPKKSN